MILLRRYLSFAVTLALFGVLELLLGHQRLFWFCVPLLFILSALPVGLLLGWKFRQREFWHFLLAPVCLILSTVFILLFIDDKAIGQLLVAGSALLIGWYTENVFLFHFRPEQYQPYALEHISIYMNLLSTFLFFSSLFATRVFLSVSMFPLLIFGAVVAGISSLQLVWSIKVPWQRGWIIASILTLILMELFGVVSILPTSFFVAGLLLTIPSYLMMNFTRHALRSTLTRRIIFRNTVIGSLAFAITFVTAPWV